MEEKADMPMFLFPGSVGVTSGITVGVTGEFTIKTKERKSRNFYKHTLLKQLTI